MRFGLSIDVQVADEATAANILRVMRAAIDKRVVVTGERLARHDRDFVVHGLEATGERWEEFVTAEDEAKAEVLAVAAGEPGRLVALTRRGP